MRSNSVGLWAHEIGHCFGLGHANFWNTAGSSSIGNGINEEYGDTYDIMGSSGSFPAGHYNTQAKNQIRWLPNNFLQPVTQSGLYRVYAYDTGTLDPTRRYALNILKDAQRTYWAEVHSLFDTNPWMKNGLLLGWRFPNGGGGNFQLIDTTNGSPFLKEDAAISAGSTFSDTEHGIHITTVAANDSPRYMDVQVNLGSFPGNQRPALALAASAAVVPLNATVTFTATASDPDGDTLAYAWQHFGSSSVKIASPNAAVITRQFTTAGTYVVTCTVSDMKGGTTTRNQLITVGSATSTYTISGRVTLLGQGLQDVVVTANGANGVVTDAGGYYTIPNLSANTYTLTPLLYGYSFGELFNNSITVAPNFTGADFEATAQPVVTIAATTPAANELAPVTPGTFRISRTGDTSQLLVVNVNTALGGATKTTDYTFTPDYVTASQGFSTFTIPEDTDHLDVTVTPVVDSTVEGPETVILQLGPGTGYLVSTPSTATVTIADDDTVLPKVGLTATVNSTMEGLAAPGVVTLSRSGATTASLAVNYTVGGTASNGGDYTTLGGTATIPAGSATAAVNVSAVDDAVSEQLKTVVLTLAANAAYVVDSTASTATVNLHDDDTQVVTVGVTDASAKEVDLTAPGAQADTGTFVVTRSGDTAAPLTVYYAFAGTYNAGVMALHGVDFDVLPGSVVIPAGKTQASVTVLPRFDGIGEGPEQAVLYLGANATNYIVGGSNTAVVTIEDNAGDVPYIDVVASTSASEPSTSGIFKFNYRGSPASLPLRVNYTLSGTAGHGVDYDSGSGFWYPQASGVTDTLNGLWGSGTTSLWAVGDAGVIRKWDGTSWSAQASGITTTLRAVWGTSATNAWAVGDGGVVRKWNGTVWSAQTSNTTANLRAIWGSDTNNVWAVGDGGTIMKWNGSAWSAQTSGITTALHGVWGSSSTSVWAVGDGGVVRKWNGTTWSAQTSNTTANLRGVFGTNSTNIWFAGSGGTLARSNGTTWTAQVSPFPVDLTGIWGSDSSNLWAPATNGSILRTTNGGTTWTNQVSNTLQPLYCLRGTDANNTWAVGAGGEIMNRTTSGSIPLSGRLVIPAGTTSALDLTIRPIDDAEAEDLESATLTITPDPAYQTFAASTTATMWVRDNDNVNTVFVDTQVGTSGGWNVTEGTVSNPTKFYISRTGSTTAALTVNYTLGGTATSGSDYAALSGSIAIPAGSLGVDLPITILDDAVFEGVETITFDFAPGAYSRSAGMVMYINDNESAPATVGFQTPSSSGLESVSPVNIPVTLSAARASPVTVQYVLNGTNASSSTTTSTHALPAWVRVVKTGSTITHFESNDGVLWTQRGGSFTVSNLGSSYLAGICLASGSGTATTATVDSFTVSGLSAGGTAGAETAANVGTVTGTHTVASGIYSFNSSGASIGTTSSSDTFRFVYLPVTNSANCTVTARLAALGTTSTSSRLGVMLRSSTAQGSVYAASLVSGTTNIPFYTMNRTTTNTSSNAPSTIVTNMLPFWYRLVRTGDSFATSYSKDGGTWVNVGTTQTLALGPTTLAGLAVSAASDGTIATATYDNVTVDGVAQTGLQGRTVGFVNEQGSESLNAGVWTVNASGNAITGNNDEGYFVAREITGNFTLVARVTSLTGGAAGAQAGVMVRQTRDGYSRHMHAGWVKSGSTEQRYRLQSFSNAFGSGIDYTLAPGTLTFAPGETLQNIVLNVTNDTMDEVNNLVSIQLLNATGASVLAAGTYHGYTIVDDDNPPANPYAGFAATASTVPESAGTVTLPVSLSAPATQNGTVNYTVTGGSAAGGGVDHTLSSGQVQFIAGESVQGIPLTVVEDTLRESPETIVITLSSPVNLQLGSNGTHTLTIADNDLPVVTIEATDDNASEGGADSGRFTLSRTGDNTDPLVVTLARGGSATDGTDYSTLSTTQTIPAFSSSITLDVVPVNDATNEGTQTVILTVAADPAYVIGTPSAATVSILDDDRSTVTLVANDDMAAEGGGTGEFTITRTAPTNVALSVALTIAGTATNGTDYTTITTPVSIPIGQTSVTVNVTPVEDSTTEGDEQVTLSLNTGSYDIGGDAFGNVTIADNDSPPTLFINSPASQGPLIANGNGVIVSATIGDDGFPAAVTQTWSQISGPGVATIEQPTAATTAVTFPAPGTYILRITATDTQFTVSDQVTVVVGAALVASDWITQDMGPVSARRGQSVEFGGQCSLTATGTGYSGATNDAAHVMVRQVSGNGSIVARLTSLPLSTAFAGVTIRDSMARSSRRAVLGLVPGTGLQFRTRATPNTTESLATQIAAPALPLWLKLERDAATGDITASYATETGGVPGAWIPVGSPVNLVMDAAAHYGLTATSNSGSSSTTALFDNVTLTPAPSGPALLSEDATHTPAASGSGSESGGTYTIVGSTTGYFHGWQYYGDMVVTARLASFSSGAGSASGGIRVAESLENGAQLHLGRMPQSAYSGYYWTSLAGGAGGGVPSGIAAGNWMRFVRRGSSITAYRAADVSGSPGTWLQIGQPQTVIMTTPVWVGFYVNNASGVGMNTCTFSGLSIAPLNKAPVVGIASVAAWPLSPVPLDGSLSDDNYPAPVSLTSLWSQRSGPGTVVFGNAALADTTVALGEPGAYVLRLTADDGGIQSFKDLAFTGYSKPFDIWQAQNYTATGGYADPGAAQTADSDYDGQMNLLEYAFGTPPQAGGTSPVVQDTATQGADKFLRLTVPKNPAATDVTYTVEATSTLAAPASWSSAGLIIESNTATQLIVRDTVPVASGVPRFMRVKVEAVP